MIGVTVLCVGKLKESFYREACEEYGKRLGAFCRVAVTELKEERLPEDPSPAQIDAALEKEAAAIRRAIPEGSRVIALCVEGRQTDSPGLAELIGKMAVSGDSRLCFVIGGSYGLHASVKKDADMRLSMSQMTFPHHLARIMLLEQIYRAFQIMQGGKYHK